MTQVQECRQSLVEGTVYGVALYAGESPWLDASGNTQAGAPTSPVMFIKPRNTFLPTGGTVTLPPTICELEARPALAMVFGRSVRRVSAERARDAISGYMLAIDLTEPGSGILRPPIREKCRDGFLPIGPCIVPRESISDQESIVLRLTIDGQEAAEFRAAERLQLIGQLIENVSEYMTFRAGDVLLLTGCPLGPCASVGSHLVVASEGIGRLECFLVAEEVPR